MNKLDINDEPGTLIKSTGNESFNQAFEKLVNSSPGKTIPFFVEVNGQSYMGRAETTQGQQGGYPNYHITVYNPKITGYKLEPLFKFFISSNESRMGLEEKLYDLHEKLSEIS